MNVNPEIYYFVDTNILVYAYDLSAENKHTIAAQLTQQWWENGNGCLSVQVLQEFFVTVTRKIAYPLDHHTARQIVSDLSQWRLHAPDAGDLLQAIDLQETYRISFWDAMALQSATRLGCKQFISEDLNHEQKYGELQIINPFA